MSNHNQNERGWAETIVMNKWFDFFYKSSNFNFLGNKNPLDAWRGILEGEFTLDDTARRLGFVYEAQQN